MTESKGKFVAADILEITRGRLTQGFNSVSFKDISTDSRTIQPGELFVPLKGERFDGHRFIEKACEKGANGVLVKKGFSKGKTLNGKTTIIEVEDTLRALGDIARFWRMKHSIPLVGVTGSNGKTTTKEMIGTILEIPFTILKTEGNFNNLVGLPLTLLKLGHKDEVAVLEMGTNARSEIKRLTEISVPNIAVITNIGHAHMEGLRSIEEVMEEKAELFRSLGRDSVAIVNEDDHRVFHVAAPCSCRKLGFSMFQKADIMATDILVSSSGKVRFQLVTQGESVDISLPIHGAFNVSNALAAAGVAQALGVDLKVIKEGLERTQPISGRMEIIELDGYTIINDTYNANPNSMAEALKVLAGIKGAGRAIAVLGDMLELGEFSEGAHIDVGRLVSQLEIDSLLILGQDSVNIARGASEMGMDSKNIYLGKGHQDIVTKMNAILCKGDCVLVKGSRAMKMERILEEFWGRGGKKWPKENTES
ncbi:MAG: UDP-N-acetylmuramoyl-tripeptide--D-alanyl-D-alanine ligase [Thermodesulfobacteriota bacterium]|nr:UDP-N-acetylmuramoyl-tripeptide--D-alanyl-D-alanine ligase [Thermodesulfobacteriota bacterium]